MSVYTWKRVEIIFDWGMTTTMSENGFGFVSNTAFLHGSTIMRVIVVIRVLPGTEFFRVNV